MQPDKLLQLFQQKNKCGKKFAAEIPNHASLFINIGTTTENGCARNYEITKAYKLFTN